MVTGMKVEEAMEAPRKQIVGTKFIRRPATSSLVLAVELSLTFLPNMFTVKILHHALCTTGDRASGLGEIYLL